MCVCVGWGGWGGDLHTTPPRPLRGDAKYNGTFFLKMSVILTTGSRQSFYGVRIDAGERKHFITTRVVTIGTETPCETPCLVSRLLEAAEACHARGRPPNPSRKPRAVEGCPVPTQANTSSRCYGFPSDPLLPPAPLESTGSQLATPPGKALG